ncbi:MAG: hypothetical protein ACQSGP_13995 [Frankia sp.]
MDEAGGLWTANAGYGECRHSRRMGGYSSAWPVGGSVHDLARRQHDVLARPQLHALGVSRDHIRSEARARRWRLAGRHAVIFHRGPPTPPQRMWVALLNAGPYSALCGLTAAALDGLVGFPSVEIHVITPRGTGARPSPGVVIHQSRRFQPATDPHPSRLPPRTRLPRSLIDAATWSTEPVFACALLAAAVQQRLTTAALLSAELAARRAARHRRLLVAALGDIEGGAQSFAEINATRLCRRAGLPGPTRQVVRTDPHGRRRYLDLFWDPPGLCVEIDGSFHMREQDWRLDMDRHNELVVDGAVMLRFPTLTVRLHPDRFLDQIGRALAAPLRHQVS